MDSFIYANYSYNFVVGMGCFVVILATGILVFLVQNHRKRYISGNYEMLRVSENSRFDKEIDIEYADQYL